MKLFVYGFRPYDEAEAFHHYAEKFHVTIDYTTQQPNMDNAVLAEGYDCISIVSTAMPENLIVRFRALGVRMISTRTVGYDHVDINTDVAKVSVVVAVGVPVAVAVFLGRDAADDEVARRIMVEPADDIEERGLPAPGGAEDCHELVRAEMRNKHSRFR